MIQLFCMFWGTFSAFIDSPPYDNEGNYFVKAATLLDVYYTDADSPNIPLNTKPFDAFSFSLSQGDYNNDGIDDLAVAVPGDDFNVGVNDSGAVIVVYGNYHDRPDNAVVLLQNLIINTDGLEAGDYFGWSLASGDFDGDGYDDLAVGTPYEDVTLDFQDPNNTTFQDAGAINVFYGSAQGLATTSDFIHADTDVTFEGSQVQNDSQFGYSLASGDFNHDGKDDLAVGVQNHDINTQLEIIQDAGSVFVYYGHPLGLRGNDRTIINQFDSGVSGAAETGDRFGFSLTTGNFNGDDFDDLAVGVPYEDFAGEIDAGVVQLIYGSAIGLPETGGFWSQEDLTGLLVETNDFFGFTLASGDLNGDGFDELVIGSPYEDINTTVDAGAVHIMYGSVGGISETGNLTVTQNSGSLFGVPETGDVFGLGLVAFDLNADGFDEVIIGTPFEGTAVNNGGIVHTVFGSINGVDINDTDYYLSDEVNANFGFSFAVGDFGLGQTLHVGMPGIESAEMDAEAGGLITYVFVNPDIIFYNGFDYYFKGR